MVMGLCFIEMVLHIRGIGIMIDIGDRGFLNRRWEILIWGNFRIMRRRGLGSSNLPMVISMKGFIGIMFGMGKVLFC